MALIRGGKYEYHEECEPSEMEIVNPQRTMTEEKDVL